MLSRPGQRPLWLLALLCLITLLTRIFPAYHEVTDAGSAPALLENDPWFHARHARYVAEHFPRLARWDFGTHFPEGERGINQGLFDWCLGALVRILGGPAAGDKLLLTVAAWTPVGLALAALLLTYRLARCWLSPSAALAAATLVTFIPGTLGEYTLLGRCDHHGLEVVLSLLIGAGWVRAWRVATESRAPGLVEALPLVLMLFSWAGGVLHVALVVLAWLLAGVLAPGLPDRVRARRGAARYAAGAMALYYPLSWLWPDLVMWPPAARLIAAGFGFLLIGVPALLWLWELARWQRRPGALLLLLLGSFMLLGLAFTPTGAWAWQFLWSPRSALVSEQVRPGALQLLGYLGAEAVLAAPLLVLLPGQVARGRCPVEAIPVWVYAFAFSSLWLTTGDFSYMPPVWLALLICLGFRALARERWLPRLALLAAGLQLAAGFVGGRSCWMSRQDVHQLRTFDDGWREALTWVRHHPVGAAHLCGLLTSWDCAEMTAFWTRLPVTWSQSIDSPLAGTLLLESEQEAVRRLQASARGPARIRYLLLDATMCAEKLVTQVLQEGLDLQSFFVSAPELKIEGRNLPLFRLGPRWQRSLLARLYEQNGDNLGHFRLVYETPQRSLQAYSVSLQRDGTATVLRKTIPLQGTALSLRRLLNQPGVHATPFGLLYGLESQAQVRVYEHVAGALLRGHSRPGSVVRARLVLTSRVSARTWVYERETVTDDSGLFQLRVAYPTTAKAAAAQIAARGLYRVESGALASSVAVSEEQVRAGQELVLHWP